MRLLSTRILSKGFRGRLLLHQFSLVEQSFIQTHPLENIDLPPDFDAVIFTSSKAVEVVFSRHEIAEQLGGKPIYCVGKKTAALLAKNDQKVVKIAQNSSELAHFLVKNTKNESFLYCCGKLRTPDLEHILPLHGVVLHAVEVYNTRLLKHKVKGHFDGLLFFSPSAVRAYAVNNDFAETHSFCLGNTTGKEVASHTAQYSVAKSPDEAQLLLSIKKHFTLV
jgi:uroporphyrinogen-III synthase